MRRNCKDRDMQLRIMLATWYEHNHWMQVPCYDRGGCREIVTSQARPLRAMALPFSSRYPQNAWDDINGVLHAKQRENVASSRYRKIAQNLCCSYHPVFKIASLFTYAVAPKLTFVMLPRTEAVFASSTRSCCRDMRAEQIVVSILRLVIRSDLRMGEKHWNSTQKVGYASVKGQKANHNSTLTVRMQLSPSHGLWNLEEHEHDTS